MRTFLGGLLILLLTANLAPSQGKGKTDGPHQVVPDLSYYEYLGLKMKKDSFTLEVVEETAKNGDVFVSGSMSYVLQFEKNITNYELDALQRIFLPALPQKTKIRHLFFDADNIAFDAPNAALYNFGVQGELSGVQFDAIRVFVRFRKEQRIPGRVPAAEFILQNAKKLAVRGS